MSYNQYQNGQQNIAGDKQQQQQQPQKWYHSKLTHGKTVRNLGK